MAVPKAAADTSTTARYCPRVQPSARYSTDTGMARRSRPDKPSIAFRNTAKAREGYELTLALQFRSVETMANWVGGTFVNRDKKGDKNAR